MQQLGNEIEKRGKKLPNLRILSTTLPILTLVPFIPTEKQSCRMNQNPSSGPSTLRSLQVSGRFAPADDYRSGELGLPLQVVRWPETLQTPPRTGVPKARWPGHR